MADVRIVHNKKGYAALLKDPGVQADLTRRAEAIAQRANNRGLHVVRSGDGKNRARAAVITADIEGMKAEAHGHNLTGAIDAGRG